MVIVCGSSAKAQSITQLEKAVYDAVELEYVPVVRCQGKDFRGFRWVLCASWKDCTVLPHLFTLRPDLGPTVVAWANGKAARFEDKGIPGAIVIDPRKLDERPMAHPSDVLRAFGC
jgi:hypothetical protein